MLTKDDLRKFVPAVFADHPHPAVSDVYEFVPTLPIVDALVIDHGWTIRSAHQNGDDDPYASHRIVFDVPDAPLFKKVGEVWPTCTLFNSHNRTKRVSFVIGFFRTVCANQAQISVLSHRMEKIHIIGWAGINMNQMIANAITEFGNAGTLVRQMTKRVLTPDEELLFAKRALSVKHYGEPQFSDVFTRSDAEHILTANREDDDSRGLWPTFNRVQENLLHLGGRGGINEVNRNRKLNLGVWDVAKSFLN